MPKQLQSAVNGKIPQQDQYTAGEIAYMMGVAHRTACKFIDEGLIKGFRLPAPAGKKIRERRVHHNALMAFIKENPDYRYMLDRIAVPETPNPDLVSFDDDPEVVEVKSCGKTKKPKAN
jgi:hypothetical protein